MPPTLTPKTAAPQRKRSRVGLLIGVALALALAWALKNTGWGLTVRMVGDSADAARAQGTSVNGVRIAATTAGGFIAAGLATGMSTLRQDGIEKVLQGLTTIEEVRSSSNS